MKNYIAIFIGLFFCVSNAQLNEIGVFIGGANYIGDVGSTYFINPNDIAIGGLYKRNLSDRFSARLSYTYGRIKGEDSASDSAARKTRDYSTKNFIHEIGLIGEWSFYEFDLHNSGEFTPYIATGINYFIYYDTFFVNGAQVSNGQQQEFALPMIGGIKFSLNQNFVMGIELGVRYTFTNNLDGSDSPNHPEYRFGNVNSKDWYVFSGITLTYTFERKPCFSCF